MISCFSARADIKWLGDLVASLDRHFGQAGAVIGQV